MTRARPNRRGGATGGRSGQAMAEFALVTPILVLLFFGMTIAALYAFRAASADWGVFVTGAAEGAYKTPATGQARLSVPWADIRSALTAGALGEAERQVQSRIQITQSYPFAFGLDLVEAQRGQAFFRLWRFYAGPPEGAFE